MYRHKSGSRFLARFSVQLVWLYWMSVLPHYCTKKRSVFRDFLGCQNATAYSMYMRLEAGSIAPSKNCLDLTSKTATRNSLPLLEYPNKPAIRYQWLPIDPINPSAPWPNQCRKIDMTGSKILAKNKEEKRGENSTFITGYTSYFLLLPLP